MIDDSVLLTVNLGTFCVILCQSLMTDAHVNLQKSTKLFLVMIRQKKGIDDRMNDRFIEYSMSIR